MTIFSHPETASSRGLFLLMMLYIFLAELVVMEILPLWIPRTHVLLAGVTDALLLMVLSAPFLWYFIKPVPGEKGINPRSVLLLLLKLLLPVFVAEFLVMLALAVIQLPDVATTNTVDALMTTLLCSPLLWWFLFRRIPDSRREIFVELLLTPVKLYVLLLLTVFFCDLLETMVFPLLFVDATTLSHRLADGFLTTIFAAPIIWWLVIRPLRDAAKSAKMQTDAIRMQVVDAVITLDAEGKIAAFNPAAERIFGYRGSELVGSPVSLLLRDAPDVGVLLDKRSLPDGAPSVFELAGRRSDGATLTMEVSISEVTLAGGRQFIVIMRDVTARTEAETALRESEQRFRQIFEQTEDAIILLKPGSCTIIDVNPTAEELFGFRKSELLERGLEPFCSPEQYERLCDIIRNIRHGAMSRAEDIVGRRSDGSKVIASMHGKVITIQGVDISYCTFRDVTDRVRMEEEARNIQAKLIQANKMTSLGLLVSGVAHEVNNPNTFIMANSQLLGRMWGDAVKVMREYQRENGDFLVAGLPFSEMEKEASAMFAGIVEGSRRIGDIVDNLKNFARADRRQSDRPVNINQAVQSALTMVYHQIKKHTANFVVELDEALPCVMGSNKQLEQVVINLIMNACQALPSKESRITLTTGFDADSQCVVVAVTDEGIGMSRQTISRIMEPFFTTKLGSGGTGLGLSICQSIVKDHKGTLECESEPGKGSTFTIKIPAVRSN